MPALLLDLRQSLRGLAKAPGFLVAAVLSLALGIGANVATFSVLRAAWAPDLPWKNPDELFHVGRKDANYPMLPDTIDASLARLGLWQENQAALRPLAGFTAMEAALGGPIEPRSVRLARVSPEFWPTLDPTPLLGRMPAPDEEGVLVASHRLWRGTLGSDPAVVGRSFTAGGQPYTLVAVLPPNAVWFGVDGFVPLVPTEGEKTSGLNFLQLVGRRQPGVSEAGVRAAFAAMNARLQATVPSEKPISAVPRPLLTLLNRRFRAGQQLLVWVAFFVTALACVNLCTLVLGRGAVRLRELGIRQALGARPSQLFTPLFADLAVAAVPGMALGWAFSLATARLLQAFLPVSLQASHGPSPWDLGVATAAALLLAGLGAGLPAFLLPRMRTFGILGGTHASAGPGAQWSQRTLVAAQVALALTLLSSFALVLRSLGQLKEAPVGIAAEGRLLATLSLPGQGAVADLVRWQREVAQALEKIRALPGVKQAGATNLLPVVSGGGNNGNLPLPGQPKPVFSYFRDATDGYFEAAGIPLLEGRTFRSSDMVEDPTVAIVSRSFAGDYFPGQSVVGRVIPIGTQSFTIVGVVGDARMDDLRQLGDTQTFYTPFGARRVDIVLEAAGNPNALVPDLRRVLRAQWPDVSVEEIRPMGEALARGSATAERSAALMGLLAALALLLTVTGIYGVLSRQVESRRREVGIRLAVGGLGSQVTALVVKQAMAVVGVGLVLGLGGALAMGRVLESQLYEVRPGDPRSHLGALLLLSATALVACLVPALRAARVDPAVVLREE